MIKMNANQMIFEQVSLYDFDTTVEKLLTAAAQKEWNNPATHDLQQSLAKAGKSVKPVKVIEVCKPKYSGAMLEKSDERIVSVMMPCRISVYLKDDGKTYVSQIDGHKLSAGMVQNIAEVMGAAADEVDEIVATVVK
jgi:uncharacterized protein (DUF302 family)